MIKYYESQSISLNWKSRIRSLKFSNDRLTIKQYITIQFELISTNSRVPSRIRLRTQDEATRARQHPYSTRYQRHRVLSGPGEQRSGPRISPWDTP